LAQDLSRFARAFVGLATSPAPFCGAMPTKPKKRRPAATPPPQGPQRTAMASASSSSTSSAAAVGGGGGASAATRGGAEVRGLAGSSTAKQRGLEARGAKLPPSPSSSRTWLPGRLTTAASLGFAMLGVLDAMLYLPHPPAAAAAGGLLELPGRRDRGLPSHRVRSNYHEHLASWGEKLQAYQSEPAKFDAEVPRHAAGAAAATGSGPDGPTCRLAAASVREREAARIGARLQGAAGLHWALNVRDVLVYRALDPFSFSRMMAQRRSKMRKESATLAPSDEEVCKALVESSLRTNEAWNARAEAQAGLQSTYLDEVLRLYAASLLVAALAAYVVELALRSCCRRRDPSRSSDRPPPV